MSAIERARRAEGAARAQPGIAIAEGEAAVAEIRLQRKQPGHPVAASVGVGQAVAERHVAAAFAEQRGTAPRRAAQALQEARGGGKAPGVKLGITAGEIDRVRAPVGRFVGEGGERQGRRTGRAPFRQHRAVGEAERRVAGHRDPLPERRERRFFRRAGHRGEGPGARGEGVAVDGIGDDGRRFREPSCSPPFARLHQAEMTGREAQRFRPRHGAEDRDPALREGIAQEPFVRCARHPVENDSGDIEARPMVGKPLRQGRDRSALAARVDHEHDGQAEAGREIGR